ncbi:MAG: prepilin peptidase, partial [Actinomycetota bacterium]
PRGGSINQPPSACGSCGLRLGPLDLVPVVSWVVLRGRCRRCRTPIGIEPIVLELANVAVWLLLAWEFRATAPLPAFLAWGSVLVAQSWIDLREERLPRAITYTGVGLGAVGLTVAALVDGEPERIWMSALGAAIALAILWSIYQFASWRYGEGVGFGWGDVIISPLLGMYVGYLNPGVVAPAIFFGFLLGAIVAIPMVIVRRGDTQTTLPFGPFLAAGSLLAVFVGQEFVDIVLAR